MYRFRACNEGSPKVREDFTITEKAPTRASSWFEALLATDLGLRAQASLVSVGEADGEGGQNVGHHQEQLRIGAIVNIVMWV